MNTSIFRSILIGILVGILAFVAFRFVLALLLIAAIFSLARGGKWKHNHWRKRQFVYAESIRKMSDDEFQHFKTNYDKKYHC